MATGPVEGSNPMDFTANWENASRGTKGAVCKMGASEFGADLCTAATAFPIGILMNDPAQNEQAVIRPFGPAKAIAGATNLAVGAALVCTTSGQVIAYVKNATQNATIDYKVGYARQASNAIGQKIAIWINIHESGTI